MGKAILSLLFITVFLKTQGQEPKGRNDFLFETNIGVLKYREWPGSSFVLDLRYGSVVSPFFSMGLLLSGHTSMNPVSKLDPNASLMSLSAYGYRSGLFLRATSPTGAGHFFGELNGSFGQFFLTEKLKDIERQSSYLEYLGGFVLGHNFAMGNSGFFTFCASIQAGQLKLPSYIFTDESAIRLQLGLGFQKQFHGKR